MPLISGEITHFNLRERPALRALLAFVPGLLSGYSYPNTTVAWSLVVLGLFLPLFSLLSWVYRHRYGRVIAPLAWLFLFFTLGYLWSCNDRKGLLQTSLYRADEVSLVVESLPKVTTQGIRLKGATINPDRKFWERKEQVMLYVQHLPDKIHLGDTLTLSVQRALPLPSIVRSDYCRYLISQGVSSVLYAPSAVIYPRQKFSTLRHYTENWREKMLVSLHEIDLSDTQEEMLAAMTLGYRSDSRSTEELFRRVGVVHLLSVSGFHLAIVAAFVSLLLLPLGLFRHGRLLRGIVLLLAVWIFTFITGLSAPTVRAAVMLSLYQLSALLIRPTDSVNVLSATALILLLFQPSYIYDLGFLLSFSAVYSITLFFPLFIRSFPTIGNPILRYGYHSLALCLSAQFLTLPLSLAFFGEVSLLFLWSNVPLLLLSTILIPTTLTYLLLASFGLVLPWVSYVIKWLVVMEEQILLSLDNISFVAIHRPLSMLQCVGLYLLVFAFYIGWRYLLERQSVLSPSKS